MRIRAGRDAFAGRLSGNRQAPAMNLNPEFQRQLNLEFSPARLAGVPLVLAVVFTLTYFLDGYRLANASAQTALALYLLIVLFWGARQAVDSVLEEQRNRTWDTQRLSALGPWAMSWGKLFGSTLVVWYGGVICLAVYGMAAENRGALPWIYSYALGGGLALQNVSLLLSLLALRQGRSNSGSIVALAMLLAFIAGPWLMALSFDRGEDARHFQAGPAVAWYGIAVSGNAFHLLNISLALFWCGTGNYRLMAQELRIRAVPWVWLAFALFSIAYAGGFIPPSKHYPGYFCLAAFGICIVLTYLGVLVEPHEPMRIKRLVTYAERQNWRRAAEELPLWCVTLLLALPFALLLSVAEVLPLGASDGDMHFYPVPIVLLLLRDTGILLFFSYGKNPQRAFSLTMLYALLLYGVIPGIFTAAGATAFAAVFFPLWAGNAGMAIFFAGMQAALVLSLAYRRWRDCVYR
jgi:hypothetical protein